MDKRTKDEVVQISESDATPQNNDKPTGGFSAFWRIFTFATTLDWILYATAFLAAIASGTALALVNVLFGGFVTAVTNFVAGTSSSEQFLGVVNQYALYYVYIAIARFVLTYTFTVCASIASIRITRTIRQKYLEATLSQEIAFFDQGQGSVSINLTTNGNLIEDGTADRLVLTVQALSSFVSAFVVAFVVQWKLTLITMGIAPGIIIVVSICVAISSKKEIQTLNIHAKAGAFAEDVLGSMRTVHAFWARPILVDKYTEWLDEGRRVSKTKGPIWGIMFSTEFFMVYSAFALAFWQGIHMYARGEIEDSGTVATVLFSVIVAATSLTQLAPNVVPITYAASAASALFDTIDRRSKIDPFGRDGKQPDDVKGGLEFAQVSFAYPSRPDVPVLENFSLVVPANKVTALVGASGSGKSTLVGLCERFYDPTSGSIKLDGVPINELNLRWLRTRIRMVQQEPVLFNGTILENVIHGLVGTQYESAPEDVQSQLVKSACKLANAHDFVSELPEGYQTQIGERASMLSGGQKQRIAIARSVISEPSILLLDEATSALDPEAEGVVQAALDKASRNRTTIVIAHKLATVKNADNIVIVSKGRIIEQGTHRSLVEADGMYAQLVKIQDLGRAAEVALEQSEKQSRKHIDDKPTLTRCVTEDTNQIITQEDQDHRKQHARVGIVRAILMLLREQPHLKWHHLVLLISCIAGGVVFPAQAILFAKLQDVFLLSPNEIVHRGDFFSLMFFVVAIANAIIYFAIGWVSNTIATESAYIYRREMFDLILKQDLQFFDGVDHTSGALTSKLSSEPESILALMGWQIGIINVMLINMVSSSALALAFGWKLGLAVIFSGYPLLILSGYIRWRLGEGALTGTQERNAASASFAGEAVGAIRTINSLALEPRILQRYSSALEHSVRLSTISTLKMTAWFSVSQSVEFLFLAFGFWYGCRLVANGEYSLQQFYIVFIGVFFSGQSASQLISYSGSLTKAKAAVNYVFWLRALQPTMSESIENQNKPPPHGAKSLALDDTRFSYPLRPDTQVIRGVALRIEPGQFVALVGASGCGKTTIVALLERFYDPVSGRIVIDEATNIKDLSPRLYRQHLSLVQQEPTLYQGTIRENILLGKRQRDEHTDKEKSESFIASALHQANAYDFVISLPQGIDTQVGRSGIQLSGGQRQRIAIARALIRNPEILLLDEATSALDTESEKVVQAALSEAAKGKRITIAVAHRLSTIREADKICVFMNGKIIEAGKHQDLLDTGAVYAQMCKAQSLDTTV